MTDTSTGLDEARFGDLLADLGIYGCEEEPILRAHVERERRAAKAEALRQFAALLDSRYPTTVWPEIEDGITPVSRDRVGASMGRAVARQARHAADEIERGE